MPPGDPAPGVDRDDVEQGPAPGDGPPEPVDEATAAFLAGGPDGVRAAYEAHGRLVFTFCRRALGPERAADVTQEVFTELWRSQDRFDAHHGSLRGWIMGIAR